MGLGGLIKKLLVVAFLTAVIYFAATYYPVLYEMFKTQFMDKAVPTT